MSASPRLTGVKELLEGASGTGKTHAIGTAVDWCDKNGIESFVLFAEPNGWETLAGYWSDKGKKIPDSLHWHVLDARPLSLAQLKEAAIKVGQLSYESLTKATDSNRAVNNPFEKVLAACTDFPDDRTGKKYGPVDSWGIDKFLWLDHLTALSNIVNKMVIGNKPTMAPPDYGVGQNNLMNFLRLLTHGCQCHFGLLAHMTREKDEISGSIKLMTSAIGSAISPEIPPLFSDVIMSIREGTSFWWDTSSMSADLKTRNLPILAKIPPDFGPVLDKWKARAAASKLAATTGA